MAPFERPGPGHWILDRTHYDSGMTRLSHKLMGDAVEAAYEEIFETLGIPLRTVEFASIHGFPYGRRVPLIESRRGDAGQPPAWLIRLLVRVVPAFRRRNQAAGEFIAAPTSGAVVADWESRIKPDIHRRNAEFEAVDLSDLDDRQLTQHLEDVAAHVDAMYREHHRLHGYDLVPIGMLLVACRDWGIGAERVLPLLMGASPATSEPLRDRLRIRSLVEQAGVTPASLDDVRSVSPEVAALLDAYLERHGSVLFASYDIDSPTLGERPDVVLSSIMSAEPVVERAGGIADLLAELRAEVPETDQLDRLVTEARAAMNMRDDNGPLTVEWPAGLLRLALLEVGRRAVATGRITSADHVFELELSELRLLLDSGGPSADELATRAENREAERSLDPPPTLGPDEPEPDLSIFPEPTARMLDVVTIIGEHLLTGEQTPSGDGLMRGVGVGSEPYDGVARVATTASEAMEALEEDEVLVTRITSPAFNLVLSMAGALITAEGGAMSHAAVLARELDLPAVVGAAGCLDLIRNGDLVRVDPQAGTVQILTSR